MSHELDKSLFVIKLMDLYFNDVINLMLALK